jgi:hypothetical protein
VFRIDVALGGVCRLAMQPNRDQIVTDLAGAALVQAAAEYASGRMRPSVRDRFKPGAFSSHGFLPRDPSYVKRQIKALGAATPYVSPRRVDLSRVALRLAKVAQGPNTAATVAVLRELAKALAPRMRDLVVMPGIGHRITRVGGARRVAVRIAWPGARVLNRAGGGTYAAAYRTQFADLQRGGAWRAIVARAATIYTTTLAAVAKRAA